MVSSSWNTERRVIREASNFIKYSELIDFMSTSSCKRYFNLNFLETNNELRLLSTPST